MQHQIFFHYKIYLLGLTVCQKNTHTKQNVNFERYTLWNYKASWIYKIWCWQFNLEEYVRLMLEEIYSIKKFAFGNACPKFFANTKVKKLI